MKFLNGCLFILALTLSGCDDTDEQNNPERSAYLRNTWQPVIDSLAGEYFQGVDISSDGEMYVNYWKGLEWEGTNYSTGDTDFE
jgi:hypothetical protein